jgi:hypothetical protein
MSWFNKKKKKPTPYEIVLKYMELNTSYEKDINEYNKILDDNFQYYKNNTGIPIKKHIILNNIKSPYINMTELNNDINEIIIRKLDQKTFKIVITGYGHTIHPIFKYIRRCEVKIVENIRINETVDQTTIERIDSHKESLFLCFVI